MLVGLLVVVAVTTVVFARREATPASSGATAAGPTSPGATSSEPTTQSPSGPTSGPTSEPTPQEPQRPRQGSDEKPPQLAALPPKSLRIPSVGVGGDVVRLQLRDGLMELPDSPRDAGWLTESVPPGQPGVSVVVGAADGGPGVFSRLGGLRRGDRVSVVRRDGSTAHFVVTRTTTFADQDFPTRLMRGSAPRPTLRLITAGPFGGDAPASDNVIAYARLAARGVGG